MCRPFAGIPADVSLARLILSRARRFMAQNVSGRNDTTRPSRDRCLVLNFLDTRRPKAGNSIFGDFQPRAILISPCTPTQRHHEISSRATDSENDKRRYKSLVLLSWPVSPEIATTAIFCKLSEEFRTVLQRSPSDAEANRCDRPETRQAPYQTSLPAP